MGVWIAHRTTGTIDVSTTFPIAAFAIADDRAGWAAAFFAITGSVTAGVGAAFRDAGWAAIGSASNLVIWASTFAIIPDLRSRAGGWVWDARGAASGFDAIGRDRDGRAHNTQQSSQHLPPVAGRSQAAGEGVESVIVHAVPFVVVVWLGCRASLHGDAIQAGAFWTPKNCFAGGRLTNCKVNRKILDVVQSGGRIDLYWCPASLDERKRVERQLIDLLGPEWNG